MRDREVALVHFAVDVALGAGVEVALKMMESIGAEMEECPLWRRARRQRLKAQWDTAYELAVAMGAYQKEQQKAWAESTNAPLWPDGSLSA